MAHDLSTAEQATALERGLARRTYELLPPTPCWGLASLPFGTDSGYAGITTWVVDRSLQVSAVSTVRPSDSAGMTTAVARCRARASPTTSWRPTT